jgi:hypothetical protein
MRILVLYISIAVCSHVLFPNVMKAFRLKFLLDVYTKKYWEILNVTFVSVQYEPCAT